jgi:hypothetical protein
MSYSSAEINELTTELRSSEDPLWCRLRQLLRERDVPPDSAALVTMFPDDTKYLYGIITMTDRKIFQFGFDYLNGVETGTFVEWRDFTGHIPLPCTKADLDEGFRQANRA